MSRSDRLTITRKRDQWPQEDARDRWARTARGTPRVATDVLQVGDVIWVSPKDPQRPSATWSLMQVPEIDGGLILNVRVQLPIDDHHYRDHHHCHNRQRLEQQPMGELHVRSLTFLIR